MWGAQEKSEGHIQKFSAGVVPPPLANCFRRHCSATFLSNTFCEPVRVFCRIYRAVNNALLDTYQLKSLDAVFETPIEKMQIRHQNGKCCTSCPPPATIPTTPAVSGRREVAPFRWNTTTTPCAYRTTESFVVSASDSTSPSSARTYTPHII